MLELSEEQRAKALSLLEQVENFQSKRGTQSDDAPTRGKILEEIRETLGISQAVLARHMEMNYMTISRVERNVHKPMPRFLKKLREVIEGVDEDGWTIPQAYLLALARDASPTISKIYILREFEEQLGFPLDPDACIALLKNHADWVERDEPVDTSS